MASILISLLVKASTNKEAKEKASKFLDIHSEKFAFYEKTRKSYFRNENLFQQMAHLRAFIHQICLTKIKNGGKAN